MAETELPWVFTSLNLSFPNSIWERPWEGNSISQAGVSAGRRAALARRHPLHAK